MIKSYKVSILINPRFSLYEIMLNFCPLYSIISNILSLLILHDNSFSDILQLSKNKFAYLEPPCNIINSL